ncbi:MAG: glycosyltransferase [Candidatus Avilachnospira sp.]|jgi:glycosyltransferase involved in cell wall biosynthesis
MQTELISIIVPVYNAVDFLKDCIESLINQSYSNLEIIAVNDGSTDESLNILRDYADRDKRIKIIDKSNGGVSSARNAGLKAATGRYIAFMDADDWASEEMYEQLYNSLTESDSDISACGFKREYGSGGKDNRRTENSGKSDSFILCDEKTILEKLTDTRGKFYCFLWNKLYKKELINNIFFDESILMSEDYLFNWNVFKRVKKVSYTDTAYYHYRNDNTSATRNCPAKNYCHAIAVNEKMLNECDRIRYKSVYSNLIEDGIKLCVGGANSMVKQSFEPESYNIFKSYIERNLKFMHQKSNIGQIYYLMLGKALALSFNAYRLVYFLEEIPLTCYKRLRRILRGE